MSLEIHSLASESEFWDSALRCTLSAIEEALSEHGQARIGLAGGSTPKKLYELLSRENLPWEKLTWILIDERKVPDDDEESNLRMLRHAIFEPAGVSSESQVVFDTASYDAAASMTEKLKHLEQVREPLFDLLILGAGKDGHIASLFEGDPNLSTEEYAYATKAPSEYKTSERLTLSLKALSNSKQALLLLKGSEKAPVLEALKGSSALPLTALKTLSLKVPLQVLVSF